MSVEREKEKDREKKIVGARDVNARNNEQGTLCVSRQRIASVYTRDTDESLFPGN